MENSIHSGVSLLNYFPKMTTSIFRGTVRLIHYTKFQIHQLQKELDYSQNQDILNIYIYPENELRKMSVLSHLSGLIE